MSASITSDAKEEIDAKKRKSVEEVETSKTHNANHFQTKPKMAKSPSALKNSSHAANSVLDIKIDLTDPVHTTFLTTYLCLVLDVPPDRDHIGRCRLILSRLFSAMKSSDWNAVIT